MLLSAALVFKVLSVVRGADSLLGDTQQVALQHEQMMVDLIPVADAAAATEGSSRHEQRNLQNCLSSAGCDGCVDCVGTVCATVTCCSLIGCVCSVSVNGDLCQSCTTCPGGNSWSFDCSDEVCGPSLVVAQDCFGNTYYGSPCPGTFLLPPPATSTLPGLPQPVPRPQPVPQPVPRPIPPIPPSSPESVPRSSTELSQGNYTSGNSGNSMLIPIVITALVVTVVFLVGVILYHVYKKKPSVPLPKTKKPLEDTSGDEGGETTTVDQSTTIVSSSDRGDSRVSSSSRSASARTSSVVELPPVRSSNAQRHLDPLMAAPIRVGQINPKNTLQHNDPPMVTAIAIDDSESMLEDVMAAAAPPPATRGSSGYLEF